MRGRQCAAWGACAGLGAAGLAMILVARPAGPPSLAPPPAAMAPPVPGSPPPAPAAARTAPARLVISAIGVNAPVTPEGTDSSGALELPPLTAQNLAGWWDGGAAPGQDGAAVIAGHVDSTSGPLVFWRLRELKPGDVIETEPGPVRFTVTRVTQVSKTSFPTQSVYGTTPGPELRLVTCGGTFDPATGHYLSNVIVYATETG